MKYIITETQLNTLTNTDWSEKQKMLRDLANVSGAKTAFNAVGGVENYIKILYGGDIDKFLGDNKDLVRITSDGMNMYFNPFLVEILPLDKSRLFGNKDVKNLGDFSFGPKNGIRYRFRADLYPVTQNGEITSYRVAGMSGDSGFGYSFISKRNTLSKRNRQQIFKQILDKYGLEKYIS